MRHTCVNTATTVDGSVPPPCEACLEMEREYAPVAVLSKQIGEMLQVVNLPVQTGMTSSGMLGIPVPHAGPCPSCGYCPHCGRGGQRLAPLVPYTPWPGYPLPYIGDPIPYIGDPIPNTGSPFWYGTSIVSTC